MNSYTDVERPTATLPGRNMVLNSEMTFAQVLERMYDTVNIPDERQFLFRRDVWREGVFIRNSPKHGAILVCRLHPDGEITVEDQWMDDHEGMFADDWTEVMP